MIFDLDADQNFFKAKLAGSDRIRTHNSAWRSPADPHTSSARRPVSCSRSHRRRRGSSPRQRKRIRSRRRRRARLEVRPALILEQDRLASMLYKYVSFDKDIHKVHLSLHSLSAKELNFLGRKTRNPPSVKMK